MLRDFSEAKRVLHFFKEVVDRDGFNIFLIFISFNGMNQLWMIKDTSNRPLVF